MTCRAISARPYSLQQQVGTLQDSLNELYATITASAGVEESLKQRVSALVAEVAAAEGVGTEADARAATLAAELEAARAELETVASDADAQEKVGPGRYCSPRRPTSFEPLFLLRNGIR